MKYGTWDISERDIVRFWSKVDKSGPGNCWLWTAGKATNGYGKFWGGGRTVGAHRFSYVALVGEIPDGLVIDHLCRNRACVNPAHLEPVTDKVNVLRGEGLTAHYAKVTHCIKGHPYDEQNTYVRLSGGRACNACYRDRTRRYRAEKRKAEGR